MRKLRHLPTLCFILVCCLAVFFQTSVAEAQRGDIPGARDYPGIGRFAGSVATGYQAKDFDAMKLQAAPFKNGKPTDARRVEGRVTRIAYRSAPGASILEVARNYENQLAKAGFETMLSCETDACGGLNLIYAIDMLPIPQMIADGFNYRYFSGVKKERGRETYASVIVSVNNENIYAQLVVAVVGSLENKMVDAAEMKKGLSEKGRIALYGIYFDTDKAIIKPDSKPTLDEMAKLLNGEPGMRVFIVGHTDSQGSYEHNMALSKARADAVAAALAGSYSIARGRLYTAGLGYLSPVGSNASDEGRALSRRVELVVP